MKEEMTESEIWAEYRGNNQRKRWENFDKSCNILLSKGIKFRILDVGTGHLKTGDWNFWPTSGKFYNEKTKEKGRGVFNLLGKLGVK